MDTITNKPGYKISDKELEQAFKELNISSSAPEEVETAPTTDLKNPTFSASDGDNDNDHEIYDIVSSQQFTRCLPSNSVRSLALAYSTKTISLEAKNKAKNKANLVQQIAETAPTTDLENPTFSASDGDNDNDHEIYDIVSSQQFKEWWCKNIFNNNDLNKETNELVIEEKFQECFSELDNYSIEPKEIECAGSDNIPTLEEIFDKLDSTPE